MSNLPEFLGQPAPVSDRLLAASLLDGIGSAVDAIGSELAELAPILDHLGYRAPAAWLYAAKEAMTSAVKDASRVFDGSADALGDRPVGEQTYAELWADSINETYEDDSHAFHILHEEDLLDGETEDDATHRILSKAAQCLRNGVPATFTARELDLVRHMMPAHEVDQSGAVRWVLELFTPLGQ